MDIDLARTFLEIADSGSFAAAAERLHLTEAVWKRKKLLMAEQSNWQISGKHD
ncbi:LysR family transcriptional regulator [Comamonas resistens]|uniref:LysR family transcriptional regulator n=1 Tax=Comamonas resistens TaxID=3046670 RepID=A0ABY8SQQ9_9BURK|nr:LysR family transcriptional regulator [Comamonas resistens]WHS64264.1 LysR family transcriptional regulator [Comamonas resistens]